VRQRIIIIVKRNDPSLEPVFFPKGERNYQQCRILGKKHGNGNGNNQRNENKKTSKASQAQTQIQLQQISEVGMCCMDKIKQFILIQD
jgi:hypothetical protein